MSTWIDPLLPKIPHIRNPLTVVAVFAAFAEVSGTAVLPLLEKDVQHIYVWFLMLFPTLLILLFFATLNWNHTVLYAPSDYKDEDNFGRFAKASAYAISKKGEEETAEQTAISTLPDSGEALSPPNEEQQVVVAGHQDGPAPATPLEPQPNLPPRDLAPSKDVGDALSSDAMRLRARVAADLGLSMLERKNEVFYYRDLSVAGHPNLVFDGIDLTKGRMTAVEVKYNHRGYSPTRFIQNNFDRVKELYDNLPPDEKATFKFIMMYVIGDEAEDKNASLLRSRTKKVSLNYPFKSEVVVERWSNLLP
ncbi:hypothetical protein [Rhizobium phage RHEph21]|uniref:Uncharacterized protein n=1 Tax=Rhizobium phage RHEph21 TaxID=2836134 RepID=A0AAE7VMV2_9CAUD|nr:hypothetical protein [Rhizobium phage RHEph21]